MANTIKWLPNTDGDIASYRIERASASAGPFASLVVIVHDLGGGDYEAPYFLYDDNTGTNAHWYRIVAIDDGANESPPTAAFQPAAEPPAPPAETVGFTHDYGGVNALQPRDVGGAPVNACVVRVYTKADYDNKILNAPVGTTSTDSVGAWLNTVFVSPGKTYTIHFSKTGVFNPATVEVTV